MYTVIRHYTVTTGSVDDALQQIEAGFLPLIRQITGFEAYLALKTRENTVATVSVFETEAACEESTAVAAKWVRDNAHDFTTGTPQVISGQTVIHTGAFETV